MGSSEIIERHTMINKTGAAVLCCRGPHSAHGAWRNVCSYGRTSGIKMRIDKAKVTYYIYRHVVCYFLFANNEDE